MIFGKRNLLEKITPTFTRASAASYTDSTSGIINVASGELRETEFGLLLEKASTNLALYSEGDLSTYPTNFNVQNAATSISALDNAIDFYQSGVLCYAYKIIITTDTVNYTLSVFVEMDDAGIPVCGTTTNTGDFSLVISNDICAIPAKIENVFNNVYRVSTSKISTGFVNVGIVKYSGQSSRTFKVSGIQLEQNSYATSYIKTEASTVARAADNLTYELSSIPQQFNLEMDFIPITDGDIYTASELRLLGSDDTLGTDYEIKTIGSTTPAFSYNSGGIEFTLDTDNLTSGTKNHYVFSAVTEGSNIRGLISSDNNIEINTVVAGTLNHSDTGDLQIGRFNTEYASGFYYNIKLFSKD